VISCCVSTGLRVGTVVGAGLGQAFPLFGGLHGMLRVSPRTSTTDFVSLSRHMRGTPQRVYSVLRQLQHWPLTRLRPCVERSALLRTSHSWLPEQALPPLLLPWRETVDVQACDGRVRCVLCYSAASVLVSELASLSVRACARPFPHSRGSTG
jgi:hypothetical protein